MPADRFSLEIVLEAEGRRNPQTFTATGTAGAAANLIKVSGDLQSATVGAALAAPFVVRVTDAYGNPVSGRTITFNVTAGAGGIAPASAVTAANGQASATGTLGTTAGSNTFTASSAGLTGNPQTFTATGIAGAATAPVKVSGDNQTATVGTALPAPFVVRVETATATPSRAVPSLST